MPHWRSMTDREHLYAYDLKGREGTLEISRVEAGTLVSAGGKKSKKPIVYFKGKEKGLALNATNAKTIASMYTNETTNWIGKNVTLYPTTTEMNGEIVECIRIRPGIPGASRGKAAASAATAPSGTPDEDEAREIAERERQEAAQ